MDAQTAGSLNSSHTIFGTDQGENPGIRGKAHTKPLQFVLDDLGHVIVHARQDMRLAFIDVNFFA